MTTHAIETGRDTVTKRFTSREHDRPVREWRALRLLARYAPGLAPAPVRAELDADPPTIVMSRLPGTPLHAASMTSVQVEAMADGITTAHTAVPQDVLAGLPPRAGHPGEVLERLPAWCASRREPAVSQVRWAIDAGAAWLPRATLDRTGGVTPVFGSGDGNLANHLWDGTRVRLVDFEFSGRSDRAFELAEVTEHVSMWVDGAVDVAALVACFPLTPAEEVRLRECRRLLALVWLLMLSGEDPRNPPGTAERQAGRLLSLLDAG
jgi:Ser/Thr protein kinase RdoA (MazF antagonist)